MARVASSAMTSRSAAGRSKRWAQIWKPSATLATRAVTRSESPERRSEPSTTTRTSSSRPTSRGSRSAPFQRITAPRERTRRPEVIERASMISSVRPSARYSSVDGPPLRNGRTARVVAGDGAGVAKTDGEENKGEGEGEGEDAGEGRADADADADAEAGRRGSVESALATASAVGGRSAGARERSWSRSAAARGSSVGQATRGSG